MRKFILLLGLLLALPNFCNAVTVAWDPNPAEELVTGYKVHYGLISRFNTAWSSYGITTDVGNVTQYTFDAPSNTFFVAVTAYNQFGLSSDYSVELQVNMLPTKVSDFSILHISRN